MGIIPLYMGWYKNGTLFVASELKSLESTCTKIELFPPGNYYYSKENGFTKWYKKGWRKFENVKENNTIIADIRNGLEQAVQRHLPQGYRQQPTANHRAKPPECAKRHYKLGGYRW